MPLSFSSRGCIGVVHMISNQIYPVRLRIFLLRVPCLLLQEILLEHLMFSRCSVQVP